MENNLILGMDYPDPDVIRVVDVYYMVSTTMHFMPGCVILRSFDLVHWENVCHVYAALDGTAAQKLDGGQIYGKGMWAASLRYHEGVFHIVFVANDTHKTYHYTAQSIEGPWERQPMEGFYHDCSVLFDDDGRVYIVYGNREIHLTELEADLSRPKAGGLNKIILVDQGQGGLGYEGAHLYKIEGRYYIFLIHWPSTGTRRRTEAMFWTDDLEGEWTGGDIFDEDMGFHNMGVAQGGIVDTPDGRWYAVLFQDHGAVGRIPALIPMRWENRMPVLEYRPYEAVSTRPGHVYRPLADSDDFGSPQLRDIWQWNHQPDWSLVRLGDGRMEISTSRTAKHLEQAINTLTQRTTLPGCAFSVAVDGKKLKDGDYAGLCALQGRFAQIALHRENGQMLLCVDARDDELRETARIPWPHDSARLRAKFDFRDMADEVRFFYEAEGKWHPLDPAHRLRFTLDHFVGCRAGLFVYSTKTPGGSAAFSEVRFVKME